MCVFVLDSWYTKARKIAPKNGRPYNQLAILALSTVNTHDITSDSVSASLSLSVDITSHQTEFWQPYSMLLCRLDQSRQ